jgi:hypothetical protein
MRCRERALSRSEEDVRALMQDSWNATEGVPYSFPPPAKAGSPVGILTLACNKRFAPSLRFCYSRKPTTVRR